MAQKLMQSVKNFAKLFKTGLKLLVVNLLSSILLILILRGASQLGLAIKKITLPRLIFSMLVLGWQYLLTQQLTSFNFFKPQLNQDHKNKLILAASSVYLLLLFLIFG